MAEDATLNFNGHTLCECGCGETIPALDKKGRSRRFKMNHDKRKPERYRVDDRTGCWIWLLHRAPTGYGVVNLTSRVPSYAHRVYYERFKGPIPEGLQIDHLCRNRGCVNPDHLEAVTNAENSRRGRKAKLTVEDVAAIRQSNETQVVLARRYGVVPEYISSLRRGERWANV